jgi:hypothetical protein
MQVLTIIKGVGLEGYLTGTSAPVTTIKNNDSHGKEQGVPCNTPCYEDLN